MKLSIGMPMADISMNHLPWRCDLDHRGLGMGREIRRVSQILANMYAKCVILYLFIAYMCFGPAGLLIQSFEPKFRAESTFEV